jgi:uncharacterized Zn-binding protein involved in type VI secretion
MGSGALAAKVGSRLAHAAMPMITPSAAMVASALGAHVVGPAGLGGAAASAVGAGLGRAAGLPMISLLDMIPIITTGAIATGAFDVMLGPGQIAAFAPSLPQPCAPHLAQPIAMGSPTVLIHGMQLVRVGDKTTCGAFVCDGVKTVVIGGPGAPPAPLAMNDVVGALGAAALGAILDKTGAVQAVNELSTAIGEKVDQAMTKVDQALEKGFGKLDKALDKAAGVADKVTGAVDKVTGKAGAVIDKATGVVDKAANTAGAAIDKATGVVDKVADKAGAAIDKVTGAMDKVAGKANAAVDKATGAVDKVADKAGAVIDKATGAVDKVAGAALGKFGEMIGSVGGALEAILGGAKLGGFK